MDSADASGSTPCSLAASNGHYEALAVMLEAGADPEGSCSFSDARDTSMPPLGSDDGRGVHKGRQGASASCEAKKTSSQTSLATLEPASTTNCVAASAQQPRACSTAHHVSPLKGAVDWQRDRCANMLLRHGADPDSESVLSSLDRLQQIAGRSPSARENAATGTVSRTAEHHSSLPASLLRRSAA